MSPRCRENQPSAVEAVKQLSQGGDFPPWMSGLEPAPGELRILQAFVSTADLRSGADELASPRALGEWLVRWGLLS